MRLMNKVLGYMRKKWYLPLSFAVMLLSFFFKAPTGEMIVSLEWIGLTMIFIMSLSVAGLMKEKTLSPLKIASDAFEHMGAILLWFIALGFVLSTFITSIAASLFLIFAVLMQSGKSKKLSGTIAGGAETFFGKTKDLINLFDIPLMTEEEAYFSFNTPISNKYVPEQYIFINCLKKNGKKAELELYNQATPENIEDTERYFASNFVLLSFEQFNLQYTKKTFDMAIHPNSFITCYTHYDWLKLYKKWVNPAVELPERDEERDKLNKFYKTYRKYRFFANIIALPFRTKEKRKKVRNGILEYFLERKYK